MLLLLDGVRTLALDVLREVAAICMRRSISCIVVVLMAAFQRSRPSDMLSEEELCAADELGPPDGRDPAKALPLVPLLAAAADAEVGADGLLSPLRPDVFCTTTGRGDKRSRVPAISTPTASATAACTDLPVLYCDPVALPGLVNDGQPELLLAMGAVSYRGFPGKNACCCCACRRRLLVTAANAASRTSSTAPTLPSTMPTTSPTDRPEP